LKRLFSKAAERIQRELLLARSRQQLGNLINEIKLSGINSADPRPVILFNASTRLENISQNAGFSLVTGLALQAVGIPIIQFVCERGLAPCVLGTKRTALQQEPPCTKCMKTSRSLYKYFQQQPLQFKPDDELQAFIAQKSLEQLLKIEFRGVSLGEKILPSMRWILRRHHLEDNAEHRWLARQYLLSAWSVYEQFKTLLKSKKPRAVVLFNGMFYPEAMARVAARACDIPVFTHEVGMLPLSAFFTDGEATAYPINIDSEFQLSTEEDQRLDDYLAQRRRGDFVTAGVQFWLEMQALDEDLKRKMASFSQTVPVFTNVVFDTSQSHANIIFEHMFAWLDTVLEKIDQHPETLFILRAHPDELRSGKESRETVAEWVTQKGVEKRQNVVFIPSNRFISSYELVDKAKFVMVYNSTIGLESAVFEKPVLCGGKARYTQIPTVFFPDSKASFIDVFEKLLSEKTIQVPSEFRVNARRVLYSQLFRASLPFGDFLENDGIWRGYVRLKDFSAADISAQKSTTIKVLLDGILELKPFLIEK